MYQVYYNIEEKVNEWLKENKDKEIVDFKFAVNEQSVYILVIYKV